MNKLYAIGRLVRDAELKYTADGKPVVNFTVACDVGWGDRKSTTFYSCSLWRKPEGLHPYLKKGKQLGIEGEPSLRLWENNGKHGAEIMVNCSDVTLIGSKSDSDAPAAGFQGKPSGEAVPKQSGFRDKPVTNNSDFDDDDIPF